MSFCSGHEECPRSVAIDMKKSKISVFPSSFCISGVSNQALESSDHARRCNATLVGAISYEESTTPGRQPRDAPIERSSNKPVIETHDCNSTPEQQLVFFCFLLGGSQQKRFHGGVCRSVVCAFVLLIKKRESHEPQDLGFFCEFWASAPEVSQECSS